MNIELKVAEDTDFDFVYDCYVDCFSGTLFRKDFYKYPEMKKQVEEKFREHWERYRAYYQVVVRDDEKVGYTVFFPSKPLRINTIRVFESESFFIDYLAIKHVHSGQGIGTAVMQIIFSHPSRGKLPITTYGDAAPSKKRLRDWYERCGLVYYTATDSFSYLMSTEPI